MQTAKTLFLVVCAAGPAERVGRLVSLAQQSGFKVQIYPTPACHKWLDIAALEEQTRHPLGTGASYGPSGLHPDAVIVTPASLNTIDKLGLGISDNSVLDMLHGIIGANEIPVVILPYVNTALARRTPFQIMVKELRDEGVSVLLGENGLIPRPPGTGGSREFPWECALHEVERRLAN